VRLFFLPHVKQSFIQGQFVILYVYVMLIFLILVFVLLTYLYVKLKYFTLRGPVPGLSPHFFFGNLIQSGMFNGVTTDQVFAAFKRRYGNIFQFWLGPLRVTCVNNIGDVQHIFTHRHIYDQGDMFVEKFSIFVPDGLISLKGQFFIHFIEKSSYDDF
jgi:hypothetical protein